MTDHHTELRLLVENLEANPELVHWLYVRAAFEACGGNVSQTARRLGMYRRSLQRVLAGKRPPEHRVLSEGAR